MKETIIIERSSTLEAAAKHLPDYFDIDSDSSKSSNNNNDSSLLGNLVSKVPQHSPLSQTSISFSLGENAATAPFETLSNDLLLCILGFCDTASTRKMTQTSPRLRNLISSQEAENLLWELCCQEWPWLSRSKKLVDDLHVHCLDGDAAEPNVLFLLSLAAQKMSTRMSLTTLRQRMKHSPNEAHLYALELPDGRRAIQYRGPVGEANRSIRADRPLPKPQKLSKREIWRATHLAKHPQPCSVIRRIFHRLCRHFVPQRERPAWRPFVAPFVASDGVHLTPRLISYFEVSIESPPEKSEKVSFRFENHLNDSFPQTTKTDCIVVGLATRRFCVSNRMAGWDDRSYGYHSDDGGIFHKHGQMVRSYGPRFGVGDTVGCGVDYQHRGIFFTLNGKFLGYAFENLSMKKLNEELYPVVGIDSHCPVSCNFGFERGFLFDLSSMMCNQRSIVFPSMLIDRTRDL